MDHPPLHAPPRWPRLLVVTAALYAVAGGTVTLVGWVADVPRLTAWKGDGIAMFPNTAVCAVASGLALLLATFERRAVPRAEF